MRSEITGILPATGPARVTLLALLLTLLLASMPLPLAIADTAQSNAPVMLGGELSSDGDDGQGDDTPAALLQAIGQLHPDTITGFFPARIFARQSAFAGGCWPRAPPCV
ncbi:hypothetical protein [Marinobacterium weihaiense]|uniref:Uncharacterized protein n=1 Tax=Marinobacterium weihaiense TaxID=2851016 RepID=A0ABS6M8H7_9GAMM|nr:hypothetical protein [Marinobacterium weihaiense]MBV0932583.1 hypothetical protein [Marinobacterium weihaiense]